MLQVNNMLDNLAFAAESNTLARKLSGGQMRKLCLAVALINSPKVCMNICTCITLIDQPHGTRCLLVFVLKPISPPSCCLLKTRIFVALCHITRLI